MQDIERVMSYRFQKLKKLVTRYTPKTNKINNNASVYGLYQNQHKYCKKYLFKFCTIFNNNSGEMAQKNQNTPKLNG